MATSVVRKKVRWPSYQIKRLDNGANFGSLRSRQYSKKRGKRAGETFYLLQGSFLRWRNGGFYSFALRASGAATIKSRRSIKRQATNFRRLGRTSTPRGGERRRMWKKAPFTELTERVRGYFVPLGKRSKIFPYVGNLELCRACRIIVLSNAMTGIFDGRISLAEEVFVLHLAEIMEMQNFGTWYYIIVKYK